MNADEYEFLKSIIVDRSKEEDSTAPSMTLVEETIDNFLHRCLKEKRLPTLKEAQTVTLLDNIVSKYS